MVMIDPMKRSESFLKRTASQDKDVPPGKRDISNINGVTSHGFEVFFK